MTPSSDPIRAVRDELDRASDLLDADHLLIAVSGGADSMALLHLLWSRRSRVPGRISVAHFDHHLRADSHRDRELVASYCDRHDIPCHVGEDDVAARARETGESLEAAARHCRYAFLEQTAAAVGAERIVTGHTRDDQVETIFMRILRGSGVRGLAGIPRRRGNIVRPLLAVPRSLLAGYCSAMSVPWIDDPSNRDTGFERNAIRLKVLPSLARHHPGVDHSVLAIGDEAGRRLSTVRRHTDALLDRHLVEEAPGVWVLPVPPLLELDDTAAYVLFGDALSYHMGHTRELGRVHYQALTDLLRAPGSSQSLPGMTVRREHDQLVFSRPTEPPPAIAEPATLPLPGRATLGDRRIRSREFSRETEDHAPWRAHSEGSLESGGEPRFAVAYFARERITPPFTVRPAAPGDRIRPFGMGGHQKKLSDIFIDNKVPCRVRGTIPVVEDQRQIIWVAGVATSEATRITSATRDVVELTMTIE